MHAAICLLLALFTAAVEPSRHADAPSFALCRTMRPNPQPFGLQAPVLMHWKAACCVIMELSLLF
jgi:hypothetical protein